MLNANNMTNTQGSEPRLPLQLTLAVDNGEQLMRAQRLADKVALVFGAASDLGAEHAMLFALHGAKVLACDKDEPLIQELVKEICDAGGAAVHCLLDPQVQSDWQNAVSTALEYFGKLTTLVNISGSENEKDLDFSGSRLGISTALPALVISGNASIVNIAPSEIHGEESTTIYTHLHRNRLCKLTRNVALRYGPLGVRANTVCPGAMYNNERSSRLLYSPMRRCGFPEEVAYGSLFLSSDEASFITATELYVNGGSDTSDSNSSATKVDLSFHAHQ